MIRLFSSLNFPMYRRNSRAIFRQKKLSLTTDLEGKLMRYSTLLAASLAILASGCTQNPTAGPVASLIDQANLCEVNGWKNDDVA